MEILKETPRSRIRGQNSVYKEFFRDCWQWESNGQCSKGDNCSFRHGVKKPAKMRQSNPSPNSFTQQDERNASRNRRPRGKGPNGRMFRWPCKDFIKGACTNSFCERWHPPECLFYKTKSGCRFGEKCSHAHRQVDEQPCKRSKTNDDKSAVAMYHAGKICVFLHGRMIWKVMRRNVWSDIVSWQTGRLNNSTKCQLHASMIITLKRKK